MIPVWDHGGLGLFVSTLVVFIISLCIGFWCIRSMAVSNCNDYMGGQVGSIQRVGSNPSIALCLIDHHASMGQDPRRFLIFVLCIVCFACLLLDFLVCCSGAHRALGLGVLLYRQIDHVNPFRGQKEFHLSSKVLSFINPNLVKCWKFRVAMLLIFSNCRIGEAKVPGPEVPTWQIGICNPAGLPNKSHLIAHSPVDLWLISETHLSSAGYRRFRSQLSQAKSAYRWCNPGKHVQPRSTTSDHGSWSGVAALAKHPTRRLPVPWSLCAFDTARMTASTTFCAGIWISGCVVYGVPTGPTHPQAKATTDAMINEAIKHLSQMTGPRYLAGDLNHDLSSLPSIAQLHAMKFVEVQNLFYQLTGVPPQPTSQRKVLRDYLFISEELVPFFRKVVVDHDQWIDHATVVAHFEGGLQDLIRFPWPKPQPIPWKDIKQSQLDKPLKSFLEVQDCTAAYADFWKEVEQTAQDNAQHQGLSLHPSCKGRGQRLQPKLVKGNAAPVTAGRTGEVEPGFFGISFLHKHRFRQLRRVQSFIRISKVEQPSVEHREHIRNLWKAICRSPGFAPSFLEWWPTRPHVSHPGVVLDALPTSHAIAQLVFEDLECDVRDLEKRLKQSLPGNATRGEPSIAKLYRAVKRDPPMQVDVLFQNRMSKISVKSAKTMCPSSLTRHRTGRKIHQ